MDYIALKEADAALGIEDPAESAAELNKQTQIVTAAVSTNEMRNILWPPLEYAEIVLLSQERDFTTTTRDTVKLAITARSILDSNSIYDADDVAEWEQIKADLQDLGVVSTASIDSIGALRQATVPVWEPPVTYGDIQTARAL